MEQKLAVLKEYLISEVDQGVEYLGDDLKTTLVGSLMEPIFQLLIGPEQRTRTINLLDKIVDIAAQGPITDIVELVDKHAQDLLNTDPINQNLRKSLSVYSQAKEYLILSYRNRITFYNKLLAGSGQTWQELYRSGFASGEECLEYIKPEIEANLKLLDLIKKNRRIINVSGLIRADVIDSMLKLHKYTHERLLAIPGELFS